MANQQIPGSAWLTTEEREILAEVERREEVRRKANRGRDRAYAVLGGATLVVSLVAVGALGVFVAALVKWLDIPASVVTPGAILVLAAWVRSVLLTKLRDAE